MGSCLPKFYQEAESSAEPKNVNFASENVHIINTTETWNEKLSEADKAGKIVVANFSATWCGPCRAVSSLYTELAEKHTSLMFLLVDVDQLTEFSTLWDIKATPTFFFLRNGQQIDKLVGANRAELQRKITEILKSEEQT